MTMTCQQFQKDAAFEATTSGKLGSGPLSHLKGCKACVAWVAEQSKRSDRWELFARKIVPAQSAPEEGRFARFMKSIGL